MSKLPAINSDTPIKGIENLGPLLNHLYFGHSETRHYSQNDVLSVLEVRRDVKWPLVTISENMKMPLTPISLRTLRK